MRCFIRACLSALSIFAFSSLAVANEPPPPPPEKPKPQKPSGLTGNQLPFCEIGTYPAGNICKPAPPGYYAPSGTKFPKPCPVGMTSPYGARSPNECKPE